MEGEFNVYIDYNVVHAETINQNDSLISKEMVLLRKNIKIKSKKVQYCYRKVERLGVALNIENMMQL